MTIRVVNQAEEAWLDLITDVDTTMRLFTNDVDLGLTEAQKDALTQAAFTEATFTGYAAVSQTTAWTTTPGTPSTATRPDNVFTSSADQAPQTIRGYYVTRNSDGALWWYEYLSDGPFVVQLNGDFVRIPPQLTLDDDREAVVFAGGLVLPPFESAGSDTAKAGTSDTDMVLNNVPVVAGRKYLVHLHCEFSLSAAVGLWTANLKINGVVVDRFGRMNNPAASALGVMVDGWLEWTAPATLATDDFLVHLIEHSGTATCQPVGTATTPRRLAIYDVGVA